MPHEYSKDSQRKKIYVASPLFNSAEQEFNQKIKRTLSKHFDVFLPQEDGGLIVDLIKDGLSPEVAAHEVFKIDTGAIDSCDLLLIILDGRTIDEGAAFELGYAHAKGKLCFGLQTDIRRLLSFGNNPMIECSCEIIFDSLELMIGWLEARFIEVDEREFLPT